jgi:hypothetical protein
MLIPTARTVAVEELAESVAAETLSVGDSRIIEFLSHLSERWMSDAVRRTRPELASLGFFLRRKSLESMVDEMRNERINLRRPLGSVLHFAPANVETLFMYSLALSAICGNSNIVRISERSGPTAEAIIAEIRNALSDNGGSGFPGQAIVAYPHDDDITARLSGTCDLRVVWGGDGAVTDIRRFPLRPRARDLTFPDRASLAVIDVASYLSARPAVRHRMASGLYNDIFWFDQAACGSPRVLYWLGAPDAAADARDDLMARLKSEVARRSPEIDTAMAIEKRVSAYGLVADGHASAVAFEGNALAYLHLTRPSYIPRGWLGAGVLPMNRIDALSDLRSVLTSHEQTLAYFGVAADELESLCALLDPGAVDRIVPIGQALTFDRYWDGYDLLSEFTRTTAFVA